MDLPHGISNQGAHHDPPCPSHPRATWNSHHQDQLHQWFQMIHDPKCQCFSWGGCPRWVTGQIQPSRTTWLETGTVPIVQLDLLTKRGCIPGPQSKCLVLIHNQHHPYLVVGPNWVGPMNEDRPGSRQQLCPVFHQTDLRRRH